MVGKQEVIKYEVSDTIGREQNHHECEMKWEGAKARKDSEENTGTKSSKEEIKENETKARNRIKSREGGQRRSNICKTEFPSKKKIPNSEQNKYFWLKRGRFSKHKLISLMDFPYLHEKYIMGS